MIPVTEARRSRTGFLKTTIIAGGSLAGLAASLWLPAAFQVWPVVLRTVLLFLIVKAGGELTELILIRRELIILEDFIRDFSVFAGLAVLSAGCILLAARLIGGWVEPVVPAIGAHVAYTLLPGQRHL